MRSDGDQQKLQAAYFQHQRGNIHEAGKLYREVIHKDPSNYYALHFLGLVEATSGKFEEAKALMGRSLSIRPPNVEFMENYAGVLVKLSDYDGALQTCRDGLKLKPDSISLLYISAGASLKLRKFQESLAQFDKVLRLQPSHVPALCERSMALAELKQYEAAIASVHKALTIAPDYPDAHLNLGNLYAMMKRSDEALSAYDRALRINPGLADVFLGRGNVLSELNRDDEALANFERAIALAPDHAEAHNRKGVVLLQLGRFAEATAPIDRAIELAPKKGDYYQTLTMAKTLSPEDPRLQAMKDLANDVAELPINEQISLHFALAKALEDTGDRAGSFQHLVAGNGLKRRQFDYDEASALGVMERTQRAFTADLLRARGGRGDPSELPVFIVGMPRSGSTLVEQILASHPNVHGAGEIGDWLRSIDEIGGPVAEARDTPEAISRATDHELASLGADYVARLRKETPEAMRIANKALLNFKSVGLIHLALPNARIIHTHRDPLDTCLSCFTKMFDDHLPYTFDLGELGRYYRGYEALMAHWRDALPEGVMLEVQYEEVVEELESQARRIVAHCGLQWDERCLSFHKTERPVRTASLTQVRQPIYKGAVGRWRAYEPFLKPLLAELEK